MIVNFSVRNFGPIKDTQTLSFEAETSKDLENYYIISPKEGVRLLKIGIIYGANASGKSTILQALNFLREIVRIPLETKDEKIIYKPFLGNQETIKGDSDLCLEFFYEEIKYLYNITFNKDAILKEELYFYQSSKSSKLYKRTTEVDKKIAKIEFGSKLKIKNKDAQILKGNTLWNNTVLSTYRKTNIEVKELQKVINWFIDNLNKLITPSKDLDVQTSTQIDEKIINKNNIINILKKADLLIDDVTIKKEEFVDFSDFLDSSLKRSPFKQKKLNLIRDNDSKKIYNLNITFKHTIKTKNGLESFYLPIEEESVGTQKFYGFAGIMDRLIREQGIFSIDEIDCSLHPDLLEFFLLAFLINATKSQLIVTTHYRELLIKRNILRPDAIWFTEKDEGGATELYSLANFKSNVIRKDTNSIYNAYSTGRLGATPKLGSYYIDFEYEKTEK